MSDHNITEVNKLDNVHNINLSKCKNAENTTLNGIINSIDLTNCFELYYINGHAYNVNIFLCTKISDISM